MIRIPSSLNGQATSGNPMTRRPGWNLLIDSTPILSEHPLSGFMTKWEYLVVSPLLGSLPNDSAQYIVGIRMNSESVKFDLIQPEPGTRRVLDVDCENYKKWNSHGHHLLFNELGNEGWELIKIRGSDRELRERFFFFKRSL